VSDFLASLIESARRVPPAPRWHDPAQELEVDEEVEASPAAPAAPEPRSAQPAPVAPAAAPRPLAPVPAPPPAPRRPLRVTPYPNDDDDRRDARPEPARDAVPSAAPPVAARDQTPVSKISPRRAAPKASDVASPPAPAPAPAAPLAAPTTTSAERPPVRARRSAVPRPVATAPAAAGEEVVRISIGRIEVRAESPPTVAAVAAPAPLARPKLSLDDYLASRDGARR
jgi:hypothetical protein